MARGSPLTSTGKKTNRDPRPRLEIECSFIDRRLPFSGRKPAWQCSRRRTFQIRMSPGQVLAAPQRIHPRELDSRHRATDSLRRSTTAIDSPTTSMKTGTISWDDIGTLPVGLRDGLGWYLGNPLWYSPFRLHRTVKEGWRNPTKKRLWNPAETLPKTDRRSGAARVSDHVSLPVSATLQNPSAVPRPKPLWKRLNPRPVPCRNASGIVSR